MSAYKNTPIHLNNCAIMEQDGNGERVGRCMYYIKEGYCPRHGDVTSIQDLYKKTGKLTLESDLNKL